MSVEIAWKQNILVTDSYLLKLLLVVFGFGSQAFICEFSRQNICSVCIYYLYFFFNPSYAICVRRQAGHCCIEYSLCSDASSWTLDNLSATEASQDELCTGDWVGIDGKYCIYHYFFITKLEIILEPK